MTYPRRQLTGALLVDRLRQRQQEEEVAWMRLAALRPRAFEAYRQEVERRWEVMVRISRESPWGSLRGKIDAIESVYDDVAGGRL